MHGDQTIHPRLHSVRELRASTATSDRKSVSRALASVDDVALVIKLAPKSLQWDLGKRLG